jgi:hypothetical protein
MKKDPVQLPRHVWVSLRKSDLVRTAQEQRYYLLHNAPGAIDPETQYSTGINRSLVAALSLDASTQSLELAFKCAAKPELDLLLEGSKLQINEK